MKNQKLLIWGSFFGAIAVVLIIMSVLYWKDANRIAKLEKIYADWKIVEGKITNFQASFPGKPEYATQDLPISDSGQTMRQEIYVGEDGGTSYFVSATSYPAEVTGKEEENLQQALDGIVKAIPGGEIVFSNYKVPFLGANYLEYKIHSAENTISYKGRILFSLNSLYQVYVSYKEVDYDDDAYTYFANSLQIK
ncbi:MAG: hypothetical protein Q8R29_03960 [bacterium]|nr:hypothetical protein [bacterium]